MNKKNQLVDLPADLGDVGQLRGQDFTVQNTSPSRRKTPKDKGKSPITGKGLPHPNRP